MKFCENCGKQLADDAKFCSGCGSPTTSFYKQQNQAQAQPQPQPQQFYQTQTTPQHSPFYNELCEWRRKTTTYFVFSLISIITCMGIGIVFSIIACVIGRKIPPFQHANMLTAPEDINLYNETQSRIKTSGTLAVIGGAINVVLWSLVILFAYIGS